MVSEAVVDVASVAQVDLDTLRTNLTKSVAGFTLSMNVDYPSESLANIVKTALAVDPELQPDKVQREMSVQGARLSVTFTALEARFLRASFSAFMDLLVLATKTIEQFGPSSSFGQYCHL
ncbi:EKC/KEOPS complex subunit PCC1 [Physcomitrium patens]|uniref:Uncharacterized protein n=1 Tax=Physcomitrium patens TaxID=3218 RepID=A0A2K1JE01_PHYPA|nr:uncharacterized protein LOC112292193 [Physcomitrium patens]XP_024396215.1 uncharacterized protein LOC112292193 [Physcomitrium patens]PNR39762.1 hypothetical protein PHYPA_020042 [Physcomitrium patens]|eukprot:XP_024396214.1 uncharacterized protein LOC112292193 [Physcomitrella patens]